MKLLIDMNLSPSWVGLLAEAGFEAAHWSDLGAVDAADKEIMTYARTNGYVVITHDLQPHFNRGRRHQSVASDGG